MPRPRPSQPTRSNRADVRNPILLLPSAHRLAELDPATRAELRSLLLELRTDAQKRAEDSWRRHKAPIATYWKGVACYAGHISRLLR